MHLNNVVLVLINKVKSCLFTSLRMVALLVSQHKVLLSLPLLSNKEESNEHQDNDKTPLV